MLSYQIRIIKTSYKIFNQQNISFWLRLLFCLPFGRLCFKLSNILAVCVNTELFVHISVCAQLTMSYMALLAI